MVKFSNLRERSAEYFEIQKRSLLHSITLAYAKVFPFSVTLQKLLFYEKFLNFNKVSGVYILLKNDINKILESSYTYKDSLIEYLYQNRLIEKYKQNFRIKRDIRLLLDSGIFNKIPEEIKSSNFGNLKRSHYRMVSDYIFILNIIKYYRKKETEPNKSIIFSKLKKLIDNNQLDYEIRLCETLYHLADIRIPDKIISPFDDDYYTESGRNAFHNFTKLKFQELIKQIHNSNKIHAALDIGCGYGNYIESMQETLAETEITGVELQEEVFKIVAEKFSANQKIKIINQNIFLLSETSKYDLILLNYVLFYFTHEQKKELFKKINNILTPNGSVLICQYYSGLEKIKKGIMQLQNDNSFSKKLQAYYGNKILYSNSLWNDTSDGFSTREEWNSFTKMLHENNFYINQMTNADSYYYSLFIEICKNENDS